MRDHGPGRSWPRGSLLVFALALTLSACATQESRIACATVDCVFEQEVERPLYRACMGALFMYEHESRATQEAIRAEYRYPLTSSDSYKMWRRMGGTGPSPDDWCRKYAQVSARQPMLARVE